MSDLTFSDILRIVADLPNDPAPPGFRWEAPWQSGPSFVCWRRMFSNGVDPADGQMLTVMCNLSIGDLKRPEEERDDIAHLQQETASQSIVDLALTRGLNR